MTITSHLAERTQTRWGLAPWSCLALLGDYLLIAGVHAWLLSYGIASVVTVVLLFVALGWVAFGLARIPTLRSFALSLATLAIGLCLIELLLRYGVATHQSYLERQGSFFSYSLYSGHKLANINKRAMGFEDLHLHIRKPGSTSVARNSEFALASHYNSLGLREREVPIEKVGGELRIVVIGDSYTQGIGADQESTWPRYLERAFEQGPIDRPVTVINGGIAGSDPVFGYVLLERRLIAFQPDWVVVALNTSDIFDVVKRGGAERFRDDNSLQYTKGPWWEPLHTSSYIVRHVAHDLFRLNWRLMSPEATERARRQALATIGDCLQDFVRLASQHQASLLIVVHPMVHQVPDSDPDLDQLLETVRAIPGTQVLDLRQYFSEQTDLPDDVWQYYWPIDRHHNAAGYQLFAEGVYQALISSGHLAAVDPRTHEPLTSRSPDWRSPDRRSQDSSMSNAQIRRP